MAETTLKAIPTKYKGFHFRSRLEARWAVFFDTSGIKWEYEREGYELDGVCYLPDFWLPEQQYWIEIKGQEPSKEEKKKAQCLAKQSGYPMFFLGPDLMPPETSVEWAYGCLPEDSGEKVWRHQHWCECPVCHQLKIASDGLPFLAYKHSCLGHTTYVPEEGVIFSFESHPNPASGSVFFRLTIRQEEFGPGERELFGGIVNGMNTRQTEILLEAYEAARSARFEFGQSGA